MDRVSFRVYGDLILPSNARLSTHTVLVVANRMRMHEYNALVSLYGGVFVFHDCLMNGNIFVMPQRQAQGLILMLPLSALRRASAAASAEMVAHFLVRSEFDRRRPEAASSSADTNAHLRSMVVFVAILAFGALPGLVRMLVKNHTLCMSPRRQNEGKGPQRAT